MHTQNRNQIQELNSVMKKYSKLCVSFLTFSIIYSRLRGIQAKKAQSLLQAKGLKRLGHYL